MEPEDSSLQRYLDSIRDTPILTAEQTGELAQELRESESLFREAIAHVPGTAIRIVELWQERVDEGRVTGTLCHGHRDETRKKDWSQHIDRVVRRISPLLKQWEEATETEDRTRVAAKLAKQVEKADILFETLEQFHGEFRELMKANPSRARRELRRRLGLDHPEPQRRVWEAAAALDVRAEARGTFTRHNLRLVIKLAKRFRRKEIPFEDLIQEGNLGLMRAVEKFDHSRGYAFTTYAAWWIEQAIIRAIQRQSRTVRLPSHVHDRKRKFQRTREMLEEQLGRRPSVEELAEAMELSLPQVQLLVEAGHSILSLDEPVGEDGNDTGMDRLVDHSNADPTVGMDWDGIRDVLRSSLRDLSPREREILMLRYGNDEDDSPLTLRQIGARIGLSGERVRQIEAQALEQLRARPGVQQLAGFLSEDEA